MLVGVLALAGAGAALAAGGGHHGGSSAAHGSLLSISPGHGTAGHGFRGPGLGHPGGPADDIAAAADYLGTTASALVTDLQSGKTLAQVADATSGKSSAGLIAALVAHEQTELAAAVTAGKLTQAQSDTIAANLTQRVTDLVNGTRPAGPGPGFGRGLGGDLKTAADYLGLTTSALRTDLRSGKTLAQVADATSGKSSAGLIAALVADEQAKLAAAVTAGKLTQAQADAITANLTQRVTDRVNGTRPAGEPGPGAAATKAAGTAASAVASAAARPEAARPRSRGNDSHHRRARRPETRRAAHGDPFLDAGAGPAGRVVTESLPESHPVLTVGAHRGRRNETTPSVVTERYGGGRGDEGARSSSLRAVRARHRGRRRIARKAPQAYRSDMATLAAGASGATAANQPPPLAGHDLFAENRPLAEALEREGAGWAAERCSELGRLLTGEPLEWGRLANENPPKLRTHDRFGERIDEVEFHPAWHELMRLSFGHGLHALSWTEPRAGAHVARAALFTSSRRWSRATAARSR